MVDLDVLDPSNPRSVAYQLDRIETHLAHRAAARRRWTAVGAAAGRRRGPHDRVAHRPIRGAIDDALIPATEELR